MFSEGNCKGAITYRSYWSRMDPATEEPVDAGVSDGNAVDLNDASARYSRIHHVPETAYVEVGTDADESLLPVLRGVSMVPCDPDSCCGQCFSIPKSVRAPYMDRVRVLWQVAQAEARPDAAQTQSFVCIDNWDPARRSCDVPKEELEEIEVDRPPSAANSPARPAPECR
jgi:hypothetical protein